MRILSIFFAFLSFSALAINDYEQALLDEKAKIEEAYQTYLSNYAHLVVRRYLGILDYMQQQYKMLDFTELANRVEDIYRKEVIERFLDKYSWGIPNDAAIDTLAKYGPIIEIGAGNGYWAKLLAQKGVDVVAYDHKPWKTSAFQVHEGGHEKLEEHPKHNLFLCWPEQHNSLSHTALTQFKGDTFIYVGEGRGGVTGTPEFFDELEKNWHIVEYIKIPNHPYYFDVLVVYQRHTNAQNTDVYAPKKVYSDPIQKRLQIHTRAIMHYLLNDKNIRLDSPLLPKHSPLDVTYVTSTDTIHCKASNLHPIGIDHRKLVPLLEQSETACLTCGNPDTKMCIRCKSAYYCSAECQRIHWKWHKRFCKAPASSSQAAASSS